MANILFEPDGMYGRVPYRVMPSGQIEIFLQGRIVRLNSIEQLIAVESGTAATVETTVPPSTPLSPQAQEPQAPSTPTVTSQSSGGKTVVWFLVIGIVTIFGFYLFGPSSNQAGERMVSVINSQFGAITTAKLEGWQSDTLKLDWTSRTTKMNMIQVMAGVGTVKTSLFDSGVRYLKFPNDAGGYNIIDWKTGEKTSVSESAPYFFR